MTIRQSCKEWGKIFILVRRGDKNSVQMAGSAGESAVVRQGQKWRETNPSVEDGNLFVEVITRHCYVSSTGYVSLCCESGYGVSM